VRGAYATVLGPSLKRNDTLRIWACRYVRLVVERCGGNKRAASRALGISYHTLKAYMRSPFYDPVGDGNPAAATDHDGRSGDRHDRTARDDQAEHVARDALVSDPAAEDPEPADGASRA